MADPRSGASRRTLRVESLEERRLLAGDTFLVNFQNDEATTPTRYLRDTGQIFGFRDGGLAYGWTSDHTDQGRERSVLADQRLDTLVHFEAGQSWDFAIANGFYEVTVAVGDPEYDDGVHTINVEGVNLFNAVPDGVTEPFVDTVQVAVIDGALTLDQGAAAEKATRINYVPHRGHLGAGQRGPRHPDRDGACGRWPDRQPERRPHGGGRVLRRGRRLAQVERLGDLGPRRPDADLLAPD